jgi:fatty-acyl-CoA synthase
MFIVDQPTANCAIAASRRSARMRAMTKAPWHSRFALILALLLPLYFALAALGTKFGLWGWRTGLLTLTIQTGPILMGVVALAALISLIVVLLRKPRKGWLVSLIALLVPVGIFAGGGHPPDPRYRD